MAERVKEVMATLAGERKLGKTEPREQVEVWGNGE